MFEVILLPLTAAVVFVTGLLYVYRRDVARMYREWRDNRLDERSLSAWRRRTLL